MYTFWVYLETTFLLLIKFLVIVSVIFLSLCTILPFSMKVIFIDVLPSSLTHSFPVHPFSTPLKHQKTLRFSGIFRGVEKGFIGNEWVNIWLSFRSTMFCYQRLSFHLNFEEILFVFFSIDSRKSYVYVSLLKIFSSFDRSMISSSCLWTRRSCYCTVIF